jgi:uncharacterized damage-inducible protein DinB
VTDKEKTDMSEIKRISSQLRRAYEGEAWHGPSLKEVLNGVTAEQAAAKPVANAHSIWEIVLHIATWEDASRRRLGGETYKPTPEQDWPPVTETDEPAWKQTLEALEKGHLGLREAVSALDDSKLKGIVAGEKYSVYFMLHGVIQHDLYHAGQIALLKKASS